MVKLEHKILALLIFSLYPVSAQGELTLPPDVPPDMGGGTGVGFDVGSRPNTPIDLYSTEFILLAIILILVTSYYLRKKQLKNL